MYQAALSKLEAVYLFARSVGLFYDWICMNHKNGDLQVWWVPQVPGPSFHVDVDSIKEGVKVMNILAEYDQFQLDNHIKPDYCNAGGLNEFLDGEWVDWSNDDFDDPQEYLASLEAK